MGDETPLGGGAVTDGVVRVGDTVRRPIRPGNELMREVLVQLEAAGFDECPRWLGVDAEGRDILSWIEGETFVERGRMHPYLADAAGRITFDDRQVAAAMRLLRRYHDTFGAGVACHGDYGPWNLVWRSRMPVAIIDFDRVHHGPASEDVGYALRMFLGYGWSDDTPEELARRTAVAVSAYGEDFDIPVVLAHEYDRAEVRCRANGWDRQLARLPRERAWWGENRSLFAR
jgi:aminoglycoside phosphotransferase (APT) family kinase protein